ncbi:membrane protein [Rhizobium albus]|jgi:hypothetical protein|uniref:MAPEG family protein n=1 Tax=Georhizobium sp. MAB10 TaxID=3028319 RepID=UPI00235C7380|nr:membrane protein [Rhizobium albus]
MNSISIFWPVIVQVALIYVIYLIASNRRVGAVKRGEVKSREFLVPINEPAQSATAIRSLVNQFELPMLFIFVCIAFYLISAVNIVVLVLAWAFVISRIVHAAIHVTTNALMQRRAAFIVGFFINGLLWLYFAYRLAIA